MEDLIREIMESEECDHPTATKLAEEFMAQECAEILRAWRRRCTLEAARLQQKPENN